MRPDRTRPDAPGRAKDAPRTAGRAQDPALPAVPAYRRSPQTLFRRPTPSKFSGTLFRNTKPQVRMFPAVVGARSLAVLKVRREPVLPELGCSFKLGHLPRARSSRKNPEFDTASASISVKVAARAYLYAPSVFAPAPCLVSR